MEVFLKWDLRVVLADNHGVGPSPFVVHGIIILPEDLYAFVFLEFRIRFRKLDSHFIETEEDFFEDNSGNAPALVFRALWAAQRQPPH